MLKKILPFIIFLITITLSSCFYDDDSVSYAVNFNVDGRSFSLSESNGTFESSHAWLFSSYWDTDWTSNDGTITFSFYCEPAPDTPENRELTTCSLRLNDTSNSTEYYSTTGFETTGINWIDSYCSGFFSGPGEKNESGVITTVNITGGTFNLPQDSSDSWL